MQKLVAFFVAFVATCAPAFGGELRVDGDLHELTFASANAAEAHLSANAFARAVGNALKSQYPSQVLDPKVSLQTFRRDGRTMYQLTWSCRIVKANAARADYRFDRRGAMMSGATALQASQKAAAEIQVSKKVEELRRLPRGKIPQSFIGTSCSGSETEAKYWCITEYFAVAPP
ncbi:MAG: hypothetical protein KA731_01455 [Candidatus Moranbacteria bacterium]|nr:hypothetical protein [Candidatus Moranbacteria bacterium]MBP6034126.1 hypothetical protein [Candidatus Moranbacteria bacterium]MBP7695878.1 hypothetical protein [Candidatus Moranbacteria bacterium]